jgi:cell division transport system permease protein
MGIDGLTFAVSESFASIKRNGLMSLIAASTVAICLFLLSTILLLALNLSNMASSWEEQVQLKVFIAQAVDAKGIKDLQAAIEKLDGVTKVTFVSKEEGLERLRQQFGQQKDLLAGVEKDNPLPNAFDVKVIPAQKLKEVAAQTEKLKGVDKVQMRQDIVERLFSVTSAVRLFGALFVLLMSAASIFIISNTIRIAVFSRRREIGIMKLVGATDALIRGPFVIEGLFLGLIGSGLSAVLVSAFYSWIYSTASLSLSFLPLVNPDPLLAQLLLGLMIMGAVLGSVGSGLSIRKYLRV